MSASGNPSPRHADAATAPARLFTPGYSPEFGHCLAVCSGQVEVASSECPIHSWATGET